MSLDVSAVRQALATAIGAGVFANAFQIKPYMLSAPADKAIDIFPEGVEYDQAAGRGLDRWQFVVRAMRSTTTDREPQDALDALLAPAGTSSIKALVEADRTLGGLVQTLRVTQNSGYRIYLPHSQSPFIGVEWTVEVYAAGT